VRPHRVAVALVGAVLLLAGCTSASPQPDAADRTSSATAAFDPCPEQPDEPSAGGSAVPALRFDCLGGGTLDLTRAPGVPTVVNLWGSWCGPCRDELPLMQQLADSAGDKLDVVGVISKDGEPQAESFGTDVGVTFPNAFDGQGDLMADLGLNALPFTMFLAADGTLVHSELGPVESEDELRGLVEEYLGVTL
jgi:cytochrome c biogenesis protein CcmG/thiol:disulfide interchange protein DsbE